MMDRSPHGRPPPSTRSPHGGAALYSGNGAAASPRSGRAPVRESGGAPDRFSPRGDPTAVTRHSPVRGESLRSTDRLPHDRPARAEQLRSAQTQGLAVRPAERMHPRSPGHGSASRDRDIDADRRQQPLAGEMRGAQGQRAGQQRGSGKRNQRREQDMQQQQQGTDRREHSRSPARHTHIQPGLSPQRAMERSPYHEAGVAPAIDPNPDPGLNSNPNPNSGVVRAYNRSPPPPRSASRGHGHASTSSGAPWSTGSEGLSAAALDSNGGAVFSQVNSTVAATGAAAARRSVFARLELVRPSEIAPTAAYGAGAPHDAAHAGPRGAAHAAVHGGPHGSTPHGATRGGSVQRDNASLRARDRKARARHNNDRRAGPDTAQQHVHPGPPHHDVYPAAVSGRGEHAPLAKRRNVMHRLGGRGEGGNAAGGDRRGGPSTAPANARLPASMPPSKDGLPRYEAGLAPRGRDDGQARFSRRADEVSSTSYPSAGSDSHSRAMQDRYPRAAPQEQHSVEPGSTRHTTAAATTSPIKEPPASASASAATTSAGSTGPSAHAAVDVAAEAEGAIAEWEAHGQEQDEGSAEGKGAGCRPVWLRQECMAAVSCPA